jgi:hypothetical protein
MKRLYAEGTLCRFSEAAENTTKSIELLAELMNKY